jgi:hypothetical protein
MRMPGFTADSCLSGSPHRSMRPADCRPARGAAIQPQAFGRVGRTGGFGPTLPTCRYEKRWVVCGSALPGYPVPMCQEWVYVCCWPNGTCGVM